MNTFKVSYISTLPKEGNAPRVLISGDESHTYTVNLYNNAIGKPIMSGICITNQTLIFHGQQWYNEWCITIRDETGFLVFTDIFNPTNKNVFIKMDAFALGDNIAWMPYIELFRKTHKANVICSTFFNDLFIESYPNILFVKPNTIIENVYAQYYIGAANDDNLIYSPIKINEHPLQMAAANALGLLYKEIRPDLISKYKYSTPKTNRKYVTLSEFGSASEKGWKAENGWQQVVDYIKSKGYDVFVISKEPTQLKNVVDLTGNISLDDRAIDIVNAKLHLGVSSGLSWLAWALGTHVFMISDVTPNWHEFNTNITRLNANKLLSVDYSIQGYTKVENVLQKLDELLVD